MLADLKLAELNLAEANWSASKTANTLRKG